MVFKKLGLYATIVFIVNASLASVHAMHRSLDMDLDVIAHAHYVDGHWPLRRTSGWVEAAATRDQKGCLSTDAGVRVYTICQAYDKRAYTPLAGEKMVAAAYLFQKNNRDYRSSSTLKQELAWIKRAYKGLPETVENFWQAQRAISMCLTEHLRARGETPDRYTTAAVQPPQTPLLTPPPAPIKHTPTRIPAAQTLASQAMDRATKLATVKKERAAKECVRTIHPKKLDGLGWSLGKTSKWVLKIAETLARDDQPLPPVGARVYAICRAYNSDEHIPFAREVEEARAYFFQESEVEQDQSSSLQQELAWIKQSYKTLTRKHPEDGWHARQALAMCLTQHLVMDGTGPIPQKTRLEDTFSTLSSETTVTTPEKDTQTPPRLGNLLPYAPFQQRVAAQSLAMHTQSEGARHNGGGTHTTPTSDGAFSPDSEFYSSAGTVRDSEPSLFKKNPSGSFTPSNGRPSPRRLEDTFRTNDSPKASSSVPLVDPMYYTQTSKWFGEISGSNDEELSFNCVPLSPVRATQTSLIPSAPSTPGPFDLSRIQLSPDTSWHLDLTQEAGQDATSPVKSRVSDAPQTGANPFNVHPQGANEPFLEYLYRLQDLGVTFTTDELSDYLEIAPVKLTSDEFMERMHYSTREKGKQAQPQTHTPQPEDYLGPQRYRVRNLPHYEAHLRRERLTLEIQQQREKRTSQYRHTAPS